MARMTWSMAAVVLSMGLGCGDDSPMECPADFPVERDGFCYRADGGGMMDAGADGAVADTSVMTDAGVDSGGGSDAAMDSGALDGGGGVDSGGVDAGAICRGTHPLLEGERRFCEAGDCFCATPDSCFPAAIAATCCEVDVVCE